MRIRSLQHNITSRFQECVAIGLTENINAGLVKPGIQCKVNGGIQKPRADCDDGTITTYETHLSYLWGIIYALYVIEDLGYRDAVNRGIYTGEVDFSHPILCRARDIFRWALGLRNQASPWLASLPGPDGSARSDERDYIGKANSLFIEAVAILLCHEYAHLVNSHRDTIKDLRRKPIDSLTEDERTTGKQLEGEADNFARECVTKLDDPDSVRAGRAFASVLLHCSDLLSLSSPHPLVQSIHPDVDQRLLNAIQFFNILDPQQEEAVWLIGGFACRSFFELQGWPLDEPSNPAAKELFEYYLSEFDKIKSLVRQSAYL